MFPECRYTYIMYQVTDEVSKECAVAKHTVP